jgi:hypothetical protein
MHLFRLEIPKRETTNISQKLGTNKEYLIQRKRALKLEMD